jgi:hypothetical protein
MAGLGAGEHEGHPKVYPRSRKELSRYLKEVRRRELLLREESKKHCTIVSLIMHKWNWDLPKHQPLFDKLQARTGVYLTNQGVQTQTFDHDLVTSLLPPDSKSLAAFLSVVWNHKVFVEYDDPVFRDLSTIAAEGK